MRKKGPHQNDVVVGRNIRIRRLAKNMSQTALAERIGITFQQIQKYEKGTNRVGASRLMQIAEALDVPIHSFFAGARSPGRASAEKLLDLIGHFRCYLRC